MDWSLNSTVKFRFEIVNQSGVLFNPSSPPVVTVALKGDGAAFSPTLAHPGVGIYTYQTTGDVLGPWVIDVTVDDLASFSPLYSDAQNVVAVHMTVEEIRAEMDSNSTKLANLDAAISSRSTLTAAQVWAYGTRTVTAFGTLVADIWAYATRTMTNLNGLIITLTTPVRNTKDIYVTQGMDYYASESLAAIFDLENPPDLTGATATFKGAGQTLAPDLDVDNAEVVVEFPAAVTAVMKLGSTRKYTLYITLSNGHKIPVSEGYIHVSPIQTE